MLRIKCSKPDGPQGTWDSVYRLGMEIYTRQSAVRSYVWDGRGVRWRTMRLNTLDDVRWHSGYTSGAMGYIYILSLAVDRDLLYNLSYPILSVVWWMRRDGRLWNGYSAYTNTNTNIAKKYISQMENLKIWVVFIILSRCINIKKLAFLSIYGRNEKYKIQVHTIVPPFFMLSFLPHLVGRSFLQ